MEEYKSTVYFSMDRLINSLQGRSTLALSPESLGLAYFDWATHMMKSPGKRMELTEDAFRSLVKCCYYALECLTNKESSSCATNSNDDTRFGSEEWNKWPFNLYRHLFLAIERWWQSATTEVPGVSEHHQVTAAFVARQILDMFSPSNCIPTNPEVLQTILMQGGHNLVRGWRNFHEDQQRVIHQERPVGSENYKVGKDVGITPGKVVFRNRLIELIQYSPSTENVYAEPVLIVPAWIMKYYILDLSPNNSLVKFLVDKGHTVFMISWKNPGPEDRHLGLYDYQFRGAMAAIDTVSTIIPDRRINAVGYCIGGTLLAIAAATMSRDNDERLRSMSLLAAQTDFTEAGELMLFIDESQVNYLEDTMWAQGYLDTKQMAGAFQILRSNDLIWSRIVHDYLLGERQPINDLMAWNSDSTRMPFRMHSEYLRRLFLNNDLMEGRYIVDGRPIVLSDIHVPTFLVATTKDHVSPWRSVYKFHLFSAAEETTFVLTSGGHNAGIVSEPGHRRRSYQMATRREGEKYIDAETWVDVAPVHEGSWWIAWQDWLARLSSGQAPPPETGARDKGIFPLYDAPGRYVMEE
ncbi:MAG: alpha/beta fold hydrolase [Deltaproteobacteria bacterium]|jgi:polyhydroxyalkanoate synthase|nr:alpha/beta fold hydrolase [Deltaproteobacteria bacterium]